MYTSYIGKKFLAQWNERAGKQLTAREFFDQVQFPLFFADDKHLMHVSNSPFFQKVTEEDLKSGLSEAEIRRRKLHDSVRTKKPNCSFYVGYAAEDIAATTSGQVTDMLGKATQPESSELVLFPIADKVLARPLKIDEEEIYASWIGAALGAGVEGGFCWLIDRPEVL